MKILVVEDEPTLCSTLQEGLTEAGYAVDVANNGIDGEDSATLGDYDAVVLDVMLPGKDGLAICRSLRSQRFDFPILLLTARATIENRVSGLDSGADDYLTKPFAFPELLARLRCLLRRPRCTRSPQLRVADLEIDPTARSVRRAGQPVSLTPREYAILEYMAYNVGRVLTRDQLLSHAWPADYDGCSNVVDVFIRYLRRKLDDAQPPRLLHTVNGAGYMLRGAE